MKGFSKGRNLGLMLAFLLIILVTPGALAICGDSTLEQNEQCDDGNNANNDGCSAVCQFETINNCDVVDQTGFYGEYFNYNSSHPDMGLPPAAAPDDGHGDPMGNWDTDWYDAQYFRFSRIDSNVGSGDNYFPFDIAIEELTNGHDYHFGVHWRAKLSVNNPGNYSFALTSDDDSWLYIDGVLIGNNSGLHGAESVGGFLELTDMHVLDVYFAERNIFGSHLSFSIDPNIQINPLPPQCGFCGNGLVQEGEFCDDGNNVNGDGCSATCEMEIGEYCDNQVFINLEEFPAGTHVTNQYAGIGLTVSAVNNDDTHPDKAITFNSSNPPAHDDDLGTPNELFGGPGVGVAGITNFFNLGNLFVLAENDVDANNDGLIDDPDDEVAGGHITFEFSSDNATLHEVSFVDIEKPTSFAGFDDSDNKLIEVPVPALGDNSHQRLILPEQNYSASKFVFNFTNSGSFGELVFCPGEPKNCTDSDDDGVCDEDDMCPDTKKGEEIDSMGCDIWQFCEKGICGAHCYTLDWKGDEVEERFPRDCTVVAPLSNGIRQQPKCVPAPEIISNSCVAQ